MATVPDAQNNIEALIDKHHSEQVDLPREHLGASIAGHSCDRWLWLSFRWAVREQIPGRIKRIFRRGNHEETWIIADLRAIGMDVQDRAPDGQQWRVNLAPHVGGSLDAIIESGVPGAPKARHVAEFKTHAAKSWRAVSDEGVVKAKPLHYAQMQLYMLGTGIDRALYVAINKEDDRIYTERVRFDREFAERILARVARIATEERMPAPVSHDPSWYVCKFCPAFDLCHGSRTTREVNCRTCAHSTAGADGTWRCERWDNVEIPAGIQRQGCEAHVFHPDLVPWRLLDSGIDWVALWQIDKDWIIANGEPDARVHASAEILKMIEAKNAVA